MFEITLVKPYSTDYNTVLDEAQRDQNEQAQFGQSLTAIAKLAPDAAMGEALSVHYSGGSSLPDNITEWLETNGILE